MDCQPNSFNGVTPPTVKLYPFIYFHMMHHDVCTTSGAFPPQMDGPDTLMIRPLGWQYRRSRDLCEKVHLDRHRSKRRLILLDVHAVSSSMPWIDVVCALLREKS